MNEYVQLILKGRGLDENMSTYYEIHTIGTTLDPAYGEHSFTFVYFCV